MGPMYRPAQFRTCLWSRAGRWASGQEAGQPPRGGRTEGRNVRQDETSGQHLSPGMPLKVSPLVATVTGSRRRTGAPRSQRGTRLKATTERAFLVSAGFPNADVTEEALLPCRTCGLEQSVQSKAARPGVLTARRIFVGRLGFKVATDFHRLSATEGEGAFACACRVHTGRGGRMAYPRNAELWTTEFTEP